MKTFLKYAAIGLVAAESIYLISHKARRSPRVNTLASIKRLTDNEDYNLYCMDYTADYKLDEIVEAGAGNTVDFTDLVVKTILPGIPVHIKPVDLGCSCCFGTDAAGNYMMGRNFDLDDTSGVMIHTKPAKGYESLGFAGPGFSGVRRVTAPAGRVASLLLPYSTLDGINEKGFACCMLWLDDKPTQQDTGKTPITTTVAMRLMLDRAANVDEALEMLRSYDMRATSGGDYHFLLTDKSGRSVVVEWPEPSDEMVIIEGVEEVTNFFLTEVPEGVSLGHGHDRYEAIKRVMDDNNRIMDSDTMLEALKSAQQVIATDISGVTQWSNVYELNKGRIHSVFHRNWEKVFEFSFDDFIK